MLDLQLAGRVAKGALRVDVYGTKIEVWLKKAQGGRWSALERPEGQTATATPVAPAPGVLLEDVPAALPPAYASKKKVDWDKVAKEAGEDDDDPLNKVFKDIYGKGSDEQRRAMMKSYVESGGTVLSTNWEDVGKRKVDVSPPDGMVAKEWKTDKVVAEGGERKKEKKEIK